MDSLDARSLDDVRWVTERPTLQSMFRRDSTGLLAPEDWLDVLEGRT